LIVNELLTNSLKHAFPDSRAGDIEVSFACPTEACRLEVSDNGIGLPDGVNPQESASMGFQLLSLLVDQIKGRLEIDRSSGTRFTIIFPRKPT
jgi:two-component sensor histidine kinase